MHLTVAYCTRELAFPEWRVGMWMTHLHSCLLFSFFLSGNKDEATSLVSAYAWDKMGGMWQRQNGRWRRCISQKVVCVVNWDSTVSLHCKNFSTFSLTSAYLSILLWTLAVTCYTDRVYKQGWVLASALNLTMGKETALHIPSPALCPGHLSPVCCTSIFYWQIVQLYISILSQWPRSKRDKNSFSFSGFSSDFLSVHLYDLGSELAERVGTHQKKKWVDSQQQNM